MNVFEEVQRYYEGTSSSHEAPAVAKDYRAHVLKYRMVRVLPE